MPMPSLPHPAARRSWAAWNSVLCLIALVVLGVFLPGLRSLAVDAWREVWSIPPRMLAADRRVERRAASAGVAELAQCPAAAWPRAPLPYRFVLGVDQGRMSSTPCCRARRHLGDARSRPRRPPGGADLDAGGRLGRP